MDRVFKLFSLKVCLSVNLQKKGLYGNGLIDLGRLDSGLRESDLGGSLVSK